MGDIKLPPKFASLHLYNMQLSDLDREVALCTKGWLMQKLSRWKCRVSVERLASHRHANVKREPLEAATLDKEPQASLFVKRKRVNHSQQ